MCNNAQENAKKKKNELRLHNFSRSGNKTSRTTKAKTNQLWKCNPKKNTKYMSCFEFIANIKRLAGKFLKSIMGFQCAAIVHFVPRGYCYSFGYKNVQFRQCVSTSEFYLRPFYDPFHSWRVHEGANFPLLITLNYQPWFRKLVLISVIWILREHTYLNYYYALKSAHLHSLIAGNLDPTLMSFKTTC